MSEWIPEGIPDLDRVFMRIHESYVRDGQINPGVFRDHGTGMSTDWDKYATALETRSRGRTPEANGVVSMVVGRIRGEAGQDVIHDPDLAVGNRAHADVVGEKTPKVRVLLLRLAIWEIRIRAISG
jgi:hypothetical protein